MMKRRRGQTSFNDLFAFGGIPRPEELNGPVLKQLDVVLDDQKLVDDVFTLLAGRHEERRRPATACPSSAASSSSVCPPRRLNAIASAAWSASSVPARSQGPGQRMRRRRPSGRALHQ